MNEDKETPIGEPQPFTWQKGLEIAKHGGSAIAVTLTGMAVFSLLLSLAPTRTSGATRSARLLWQQRQKEICETIEHPEAASPAATNGCKPAVSPK